MEAKHSHRIEASRSAIDAAMADQFRIDPEHSGKIATCIGSASAVFAHAIALFREEGRTPSQAAQLALTWWKGSGEQFVNMAASENTQPSNDLR